MRLLDLALSGERLVGVTSPLLLDEVSRVLKRDDIRTLARPPLDDDLIDRTVGYIGSTFEVAPGTFTDVDRVPNDAGDNPLVEAALEVEAEAIVSDDRELLALKVIIVPAFRPVQVYPPNLFLRRLLAE